MRWPASSGCAGKNVLWQPGTDHAGIATQLVVERELAKRQMSRVKLGREKFLEEVWRWKEESGGTIVRQLRRLGASCDWSRERFTMDEGLSRAVLKVFVALHKEGLIYKDKRLVNWDPRLQTAVSDLEVENIEVKGKLWHIKYPIEGEEGRFITVATTRPETMLGDVAVAVHPEDERYKALVGKHAILPLANRRIPDHRRRIFRSGKRHRRGQDHARPTTSTISKSASGTGLAPLNILTKEGALNDAVPEAYRGLGPLRGAQARRRRSRSARA